MYTLFDRSHANDFSTKGKDGRLACEAGGDVSSCSSEEETKIVQLNVQPRKSHRYQHLIRNDASEKT